MVACPGAAAMLAQLPVVAASIFSLHAIIVSVLCRGSFAPRQAAFHSTLPSGNFLL
jgi:hypothetical protein